MVIKFTLSCLILCAAAAITSAAVSADDQATILKVHNELRGAVDPKATGMTKLYWNDDLAKAAQTWVDKCASGHDDGYERRKAANIGGSVGQNAASGMSTWESAIRAWYSEVSRFAYGSGSTTGQTVGHYTQVVKDVTPLVGCAYNGCDGSPHFVCNYAWGNGPGSNSPYKSGEKSCTQCPNSCTDNLCDCKGKMCKNGGTMNLDGCTCSCAHGFSGDQCETCPAKDATDFFTVDQCAKYTNVPEYSPYMCGFCPAKSK